MLAWGGALIGCALSQYPELLSPGECGCSWLRGLNWVTMATNGLYQHFCWCNFVLVLWGIPMLQLLWELTGWHHALGTPICQPVQRFMPSLCQHALVVQLCQWKCSTLCHPCPVPAYTPLPLA